VQRWLLPKALTRLMLVEVPGVFIENCAGVSFVVDQYPDADTADQ
jgi:hypothetical protein